MKKIYTGYFGRMKDYLSRGLIPVSIARYSPRWAKKKLIEMKNLAPEVALLKKGREEDCDTEAWKDEFLQYLNKQNPQDILNDIPENAVLCCYEKAITPDDWCHRHIVAEWLHNATGQIINEA